MRAVSKFVFALVAMGTFSAGAFAAPDAEAGRKFAHVECGGCHVVTDRSKKEPPPREQGVTPQFKTIARDPAMTDDKIRETLRLPHGNMANLLISERDTLNIIAYIASLRP
jgi:hypothetical protein